MGNPVIRIGCTQYLHTEAMLLGTLTLDEFDLHPERAKSIDECTLKTLGGEYDVGECSLATFLKISEARTDLKALPVFSRKFLHHYQFCRVDSSIQNPGDLAGKKVAIPQFWITAGIWHRWLLENYYKIDAGLITWCPLQLDRIEGVPYPKRYQIDWGYVGESAPRLLRNREVDCFIYARKLDDSRGIRTVHPDPMAETMNFYHDLQVIPITHVFVIKAELLKTYPSLAGALIKLFEASRCLGLKDVGNSVSMYLPFADLHMQTTEELLDVDWNSYGWSKNEYVLETLYNAACDQGFISGERSLEDRFVTLG
ncbi:hypothetical protein NZD89_17950 [Alicyclobacillus fastidiosus]|uniref:4,5-dihydroxyphthalate decarboxylase n=1 Tax=Alicyclobacillus fastidiosus TaxID=392011 RepID=A0ABY6ZBK3_9BACL|nr:hypothetical protein [Alicyclobacillus fastidiosus]WAH40246.1 hypothetical protein NZD89_17950 [Alicyclobacillus fastidiosus]GMA61613.1 hypothetical protein GCM10025859_20530 [Alicyclobacillus fastidiosus]